ncbi:DUF262 domain-containing protein [Rhizobium phaseoli]|uniref:DUF262 domain-containing protein n=1 Tax=Rhizobium phaseoli TaxID=396 RepID=UPI0007EB2AA3|nr:DUF262 domain-containing protein [Rhizobium phaseoli]ANL42377.1 hypothetical protein AMC88_CH04044 [Rhizobium phaseoli]ANL61363.1 hypothetical protein AMC85_CH04041 [Rhizobium phaseoli]
MATDEEELEGLDNSSPDRQRLDYPLDDVMVRSETRTVAEIIRRIENGRYVMDPDFQRDFVWPPDKQSKLIESCVMRIPLPVFYVAEGEDGRVTVVDGLQRLSTFRAFIGNKLALRGLGEEHPLEKLRYDDLPINLRERIEDTQLTLYILDKNAPEAARLDIFERVNSGVPLTRQQMRNALYNGQGTQWIADRARRNPFIRVTGGSLSATTMRDREAINRFCAFSLIGHSKYTGDMDEFLAEALRLMNKLDEASLEKIRIEFTKSMNRNEKLFQKHAFRKSLISTPSANRSVLNIALFDVMSVVLARVDDEQFESQQRYIKDAIIELLNNDEFSNYITYSTNSKFQVQGRFRLAEDALEVYLP